MGKAHSQTIHDTAELAGKLGVKTIVTMSGLPEAKAGDVTPNWITSTISWPEFDGVNYMVEAVKYQWEVAAKWWTEYAQFAKDNGVEKIAIEEFPCRLVCNVRSLNKLVEVVGGDLGKMIGMNLDLSHLMIQGAEPIAAARALGEKIFYIHGKDARVERYKADVDGLPENLPVNKSAEHTWNIRFKNANGAGDDASHPLQQNCLRNRRGGRLRVLESLHKNFQAQDESLADCLSQTSEIKSLTTSPARIKPATLGTNAVLPIKFFTGRGVSSE